MPTFFPLPRSFHQSFVSLPHSSQLSFLIQLSFQLQKQRVSSALATEPNYQVPAWMRGNVLIFYCCEAGLHVVQTIYSLTEKI